MGRQVDFLHTGRQLGPAIQFHQHEVIGVGLCGVSWVAEGPRGLDLLAAHQPNTAHVHVVLTAGGSSVQRDAMSETGRGAGTQREGDRDQREGDRDPEREGDGDQREGDRDPEREGDENPEREGDRDPEEGLEVLAHTSSCSGQQ